VRARKDAGQQLVPLADDHGLQPADNIVPVVRRQLAEIHGSTLTGVIDAVTARLTTPVVAELNRRVVIAGGPKAQVATEWLSSHPP
jgi:osmoprotectant transport system substrate-binding protein